MHTDLGASNSASTYNDLQAVLLLGSTARNQFHQFSVSPDRSMVSARELRPKGLAHVIVIPLRNVIVRLSGPVDETFDGITGVVEYKAASKSVSVLLYV
jgi:hypothetical protein